MRAAGCSSLTLACTKGSNNTHTLSGDLFSLGAVQGVVPVARQIEGDQRDPEATGC